MFITTKLLSHQKTQKLLPLYRELVTITRHTSHRLLMVLTTQFGLANGHLPPMSVPTGSADSMMQTLSHNSLALRLIAQLRTWMVLKVLISQIEQKTCMAHMEIWETKQLFKKVNAGQIQLSSTMMTSSKLQSALLMFSMLIPMPLSCGPLTMRLNQDGITLKLLIKDGWPETQLLLQTWNLSNEKLHLAVLLLLFYNFL